ncbi:unnamed protein product [Caenorhabditis bovis]|uniref:C-type lectin domain-containing protein n=1 Tax=Caenorhabditis bovis TaxID=2654633 RepID=A0A8S1ECR8_9PELO|nr:unnamed protein product [Caenorhabditis bovis]
MMLATLLFLVPLVTHAQSEGACPVAFTYIAQLDSCFLSPIQPANWRDAETYCRLFNSHLMFIRSDDEASIVRDFMIHENPSFFSWIGLSWSEKTANFTWTNSERADDYLHFLEGEPSVQGDCIAWVIDENIDGWKAISCDYSQFFMCRMPSNEVNAHWFTAEEATIESPNYPENYDNEEFETYIIKTENGTRVLLNFVEVSTEKSTDIVTVYDGFSTNGRTLARLSGNHRNYSIICPSNRVMIIFNSDEDVVDRGFTASYKALTPLPLKIFTNSYGILTSNNYPSSPDSYLIQNYLVQCIEGHYVIITTKEIRLDSGDRIKFYNGPTESSPKLQIIRQLSADVPRIIKSTKSSMLISYDAGEQISSSNRWKLEYSCAANGNFGEEIII